MNQIKTLIILVKIFAIFVFPFGVKAYELENLFDSVCSMTNISKSLVMAIAKQESGMNPLAINIAGHSYFPSSIDEAKALIKKAEGNKLSYDVGLMQINRYWIIRWGISPESLLDPETNLYAGIKILSAEIARYGFTWKAVGAYHSPSKERAANYARNIYKIANKTTQSKGENLGTQKERHSSILLHRRSSNNSRASSKSRIIRF